ncbi:hypothetical protein HC776_01075 [bacterium]|nr:hypothetical protein [bacterium]
MDVRFRFGVIGLLALLAAAVWLFPTWYPLIDRDSVPNPFPGLEDTAWEGFLSLPADQQAAYRALRDGNSKEKIEGRPAAALALVRAQLLETDTPAPDAEATYTRPKALCCCAMACFARLTAFAGPADALPFINCPISSASYVLKRHPMRRPRYPSRVCERPICTSSSRAIPTRWMPLA